MRDTSTKTLQAWSKDYEETPFFFEENSEFGKRLVVWSEDPDQIRRAFYAAMNQLPQTIAVLVKIFISNGPDGEPQWSRFHGIIDRGMVPRAVKENEIYVFTD